MTATLLLLLTIAGGTTTPLTLTSVSTNQESELNPTPLPEDPAIQPMADDEKELGIVKTN